MKKWQKWTLIGTGIAVPVVAVSVGVPVGLYCNGYFDANNLNSGTDSDLKYNSKTFKEYLSPNKKAKIMISYTEGDAIKKFLTLEEFNKGAEARQKSVDGYEKNIVEASNGTIDSYLVEIVFLPDKVNFEFKSYDTNKQLITITKGEISFLPNSKGEYDAKQVAKAGQEIIAEESSSLPLEKVKVGILGFNEGQYPW